MTTSTPRSPQQLHQALAAHFNAHDLDGLVALFDAEGALVPQPGAVATAPQALRDALAGFLAFAPMDTFVETLGVVVAGDIALSRTRWGLRGTHPADGTSVTLEHHGFEVLRRQANGTWRFLIDDPFAGDAASK